MSTPAEHCPLFGSLLSVFKAKVAEMEKACADEHTHEDASVADAAPAVEPLPEENDPETESHVAGL